MYKYENDSSKDKYGDGLIYSEDIFGVFYNDLILYPEYDKIDNEDTGMVVAEIVAGTPFNYFFDDNGTWFIGLMPNFPWHTFSNAKNWSEEDFVNELRKALEPVASNSATVEIRYIHRRWAMGVKYTDGKPTLKKVIL